MDFEFYIVGNHAVVVKYNGKDTEVIIPEEFNRLPVTHIENNCFEDSKVTTVFGKSIKSIGCNAFRYCKSLISIEFPVCERINYCAFECCTNLKYVNLPVCEYVGISTFEYCTNLTSVSLPVCTSICYSAFESCTSLTYVNLPVCRYVCSYAFKGCTSLLSVNLPACKTVGSNAFEYCSNLANVNLPACENIWWYAFYGCTSLIKTGKYKATNIDLTCRGFNYKLGKWFEEDEAILCEKGFHFVENFYDIFNYYHGKLGETIRIFEVEAEEISNEYQKDSKRVCKKIKLVNEIKSYQEVLKE